MTDTDSAVDQFLSDADAALEEYDQGYADADATIRLLRAHIEQLRKEADK